MGGFLAKFLPWAMHRAEASPSQRWIPLVLAHDTLGAPGAGGWAQWVISGLGVGWGGEGSLKIEEWLSSML